MAKVNWQGVFPAVTTQFREDFSLDLDATRNVMDALIRDGVSGLVICGTVGENCSLTKTEKIAIMEAAKDVARGRCAALPSSPPLLPSKPPRRRRALASTA